MQPDHLDIDSVGVGVEVVKHHNLQQADISLPEQQVDEDLEVNILAYLIFYNNICTL